jgi:WD40 repeat protein
VVVGHDVSPNGQWIVFDGTYAGVPGLFRIPVGGGEALPLSALPAALSPRWSPDGREIVFPVLADSGRADLMVIRAEGGTAQSLTREGISAWPTWSPDGLKIVFWKFAQDGGMWLLSRDSLQGAWHHAVPFGDLCSMLDWAPDGSALVAKWCTAGGAQWPAFLSPQGHMLSRRDLTVSTGGLTSIEDCIRYSRDGKTLYAVGVRRDGRRGVWAIPVGRAGEPRLVVAFDDPTLSVPFPEGNLSVGPHELYLTVAEHQSDIWVAKLHWRARLPG